jgi:hypothetical protein
MEILNSQAQQMRNGGPNGNPPPADELSVQRFLDAQGTTFYNQQNGKNFLLSSLIKLERYGLVRRLRRTISTEPTSEFGLTEEQGFDVVRGLMASDYQTMWRIIQIMLEEPEAINQVKMTVRWMEIAHPDIDTLIIFLDRPSTPDQLLQAQVSYLVEIEGKPTSEVHSELLVPEIASRIENLKARKLIDLIDMDNQVYNCTEAGKQTIQSIIIEFNGFISHLEQNYIVTRTNQEWIRFTAKGRSVAQETVDQAFADDKRILAMTTAPTYPMSPDHLKVPFPIHESLKDLYQEKADQALPIIPRHMRVNWQTDLVKALTKGGAFIGFLYGVSILSMAFGIYFLTNGQSLGQFMIVGGIGLFFGMIVVTIVRGRYSTPILRQGLTPQRVRRMHRFA